MKTAVIGLATQEAIRDRVLAVARGERKPAAGEPKIRFTSMRSLAEVLPDDNRALLKLIREQRPESLNLTPSPYLGGHEGSGVFHAEIRFAAVHLMHALMQDRHDADIAVGQLPPVDVVVLVAEKIALQAEGCRNRAGNGLVGSDAIERGEQIGDIPRCRRGPEAGRRVAIDLVQTERSGLLDANPRVPHGSP